MLTKTKFAARLVPSSSASPPLLRRARREAPTTIGLAPGSSGGLWPGKLCADRSADLPGSPRSHAAASQPRYPGFYTDALHVTFAAGASSTVWRGQIMAAANRFARLRS